MVPNFSDGGRTVFHLLFPVQLVEMKIERPAPGVDSICRNEVVGHIGFGPSPRAHHTEVFECYETAQPMAPCYGLWL